MQALDFTSRVVVISSPSNPTTIFADEDNNRRRKSAAAAYGFEFWPTAARKFTADDDDDVLEVDLDAEPTEASFDNYQLIIDYRLILLAWDYEDRKEEEDGYQQQQRDDYGGTTTTSMRQHPSTSAQFEPITKGYSIRTTAERATTILKIDWRKAIEEKYLKESEEECEKDEFVCRVRLELRLRELISAHREDYSQESLPRRDFQLLFGHQKEFYVDLQYLTEQGSEYFRDLLESKRKGVKRAVLMNVDPSDMAIFLDAICTHRRLVITNRNFDVVLRLAQEFGVDKALRSCENYLIQSHSVHPVRKLEYAVEYGLGLLGEMVVRRFNNNSQPFANLAILHDYLQSNQETLDQMHPDVLQALNIFQDYVIM